MGKDIGLIYTHSQYQLSTLSLKTPVSSSSKPQTSSAIELTTTVKTYVAIGRSVDVKNVVGN